MEIPVDGYPGESVIALDIDEVLGGDVGVCEGHLLAVDDVEVILGSPADLLIVTVQTRCILIVAQKLQGRPVET